MLPKTFFVNIITLPLSKEIILSELNVLCFILGFPLVTSSQLIALRFQASGKWNILQGGASFLEYKTIYKEAILISIPDITNME